MGCAGVGGEESRVVGWAETEEQDDEGFRLGHNAPEMNQVAFGKVTGSGGNRSVWLQREGSGTTKSAQCPMKP